MQALKQLEFTFLSGPEEGKTYTFKGRSVSIGNARGNDLIIKDQYVNPQHAVVQVEEHGVVLMNRAVNGATFVNGSRIERCIIENDDQIAFGGGITIKFRSSDVTEGFQAPFRTPNAATFKLQVTGGLLKGMAYEYAKEQVVIGSRRGSDLLLGDAGVEPEHARIIAEGSELVLHNRSNSGVKVNGKNVERQALHNGDKIELGQSALVYQEVLGDVRLAKPRRLGNDSTPLQRSAKAGVGFFRNPIVIAGMILYFWGFLFVVVYVVLNKNKEEIVSFGGGFGFHSVGRGIWIAKHIGRELYEGKLQLQGQPDEDDSYKIVSGGLVLFDSSRPLPSPTTPEQRRQLEHQWPKSPPYKKSIISDSAEANRCLNLAREHYANKNLSPGALFRCVQYLRRAEAYCPDSEATTKAAVRELMRRAEIELFEFFEDSWERAYIKGRARDFRGAADLYEMLRRLLPDDKNPGNAYARSAQLNVVPATP
jgi:pSer/pThr/pTyr-binding forkhead associated (FHA) protein